MKKLLLIAAVLIGFNANAQNELTGCMGLNFGDSETKAMQTMSTRPGFELYKESPGNETISYMNGIFAGRPAVGAVLFFYEHKLHTITILIEVPAEPKVMELYYEVVQDLQTKYGIMPRYNHIYRYPYEEGDGHTVTAIKKEYADIQCLFAFGDGNALTVGITKGVTIRVTYQHSEMAHKAIDAREQKNKTDY
jgi:hypothetical protein